MAEVRINAETNELCDRLIEAFRELKVRRIATGRNKRAPLPNGATRPQTNWVGCIQNFLIRGHPSATNDAWGTSGAPDTKIG